MARTLLNRRWFVALCAAGALLGVGAGADAARGATAGILPPRNPASDCDPANVAATDWGVSSIDACRALEGVGQLTLPTNWDSLTTAEQGFVLINLERVNRGLVPIVGLSPALNALAATGAQTDDDPPFPRRGFSGGGGIWAGAGSILAADYLWMYDDGPNGFNANVACHRPGAPGCWLHRDIMLWSGDGSPLVAGGASTENSGNGSFAYLVLAGYSTAGLTFTWVHELRYFPTRPTTEPTGGAAKVTVKAAPKHHRKTIKPKKKRAVNRIVKHSGKRSNPRSRQ